MYRQKKMEIHSFIVTRDAGTFWRMLVGSDMICWSDRRNFANQFEWTLCSFHPFHALLIYCLRKCCLLGCTCKWIYNE